MGVARAVQGGRGVGLRSRGERNMGVARMCRVLRLARREERREGGGILGEGLLEIERERERYILSEMGKGRAGRAVHMTFDSCL